MLTIQSLFLTSIIIAFCSAVCGYVYICILQRAGYILSSWHRFLVAFFKCDERYHQGKRNHWLYKILGECEKCCSGQIALWTFLYFAIKENIYSVPLSVDIISVVMFHVFTICCAIVFTFTIKNLDNE